MAEIVYETEKVKLYWGDCLSILPTLGKIDAVVTDPPYGIDIGKSQRLCKSRGFNNETWDEQPADGKTVDYLLTLLAKKIIWGGNYFNLPPTRCFLIWDKRNDGRDFADCEMAWTNIDAVARIYRERPMNMDGGKIHPTQKPVALVAWCIQQAKVQPGQTVLDPYMGSGTTGVAAIKLGCKFIGCEISEKYCRIAIKRIRAAESQGQLFEQPTVPETTAELFGGAS